MRLDLEDLVDEDGRQGFSLTTLNGAGVEVVWTGHVDHAAEVIDWFNGPRDAATLLTGVLLEAARAQNGGEWLPR